MPWKKRMAMIELGECTEAVTMVRPAQIHIMRGKKKRGLM